jgi:hypothetical protein
MSSVNSELIDQVVKAIKGGDFTIKDIIKNLVPKREKKSKLNRSKEDIKAYQKEWYQKNKEYVLTKVKLQTEQKKKLEEFRLKELNELKEKYEASIVNPEIIKFIPIDGEERASSK